MEIAYQGDARGEIEAADPSYGEYGRIRSHLRHLCLSLLSARAQSPDGWMGGWMLYMNEHNGWMDRGRHLFIHIFVLLQPGPQSHIRIGSGIGICHV